MGVSAGLAWTESTVLDGEGMTIGEGRGFLRILDRFRAFAVLMIAGGDCGFSIRSAGRSSGGEFSSLKGTGESCKEEGWGEDSG